MKNIKWIFFDIGSTLIDESECYKKRYEEMTEGSNISVEQLENKIIDFARTNKKADHEAARFYGLDIPKWHKELEKPFKCVENRLEELVCRGYRLGVIANQSPGTESRLKNWGLMRFFDLVLASAEEGVAKPDAEIFKRALNKAGCLPENAVMVGDRLDNDIAPAKALGMKTVWVRQGFGKYASPCSEAETADRVIDGIDEIVEIFA